MAKVLYVTMGTSLFHSATWEPDEGLKNEVPRYSGWLVPEYLASPDLRLTDVRTAEIRAKLRERLTADSGNVQRWTNLLPRDLRDGHPDSTTVMRYSAELSTILKLAEEESARHDRSVHRGPGLHGSSPTPAEGQPGGGGSGLRAFLRSYSAIQLVCDPNSHDAGPNLPGVAAAHLASYLDAIADRRVASLLPIPGLSAKEPKKLLAALREFRATVSQDEREIDLVVSGGYKLYGILLAPLASERELVRLIYIHEDGDVVIYDGEATIQQWTTQSGPA